MTETFAISPIGYVRSPYRTHPEVPLQGGPATLEISPGFVEALDGLEGSSHLIVMGFLHLADRTALRARPVKVDPNGPAKGVFSTRSPSRPNPISVTVVPLLARRGACLDVERLDLVDGTPLVDLKSYCPGWDGVFCAQHKHRAGPEAVDDARLAACMERDLANFMGEAARGTASRWGLAAVFVASRRLGVDPRDPGTCVTVNRVDETTEALMALTGAAFSNQRLHLAPDGGPVRVRFVHAGRTVSLVAQRPEPGGREDWPRAFAQEEG